MNAELRAQLEAQGNRVYDTFDPRDIEAFEQGKVKETPKPESPKGRQRLNQFPTDQDINLAMGILAAFATFEVVIGTVAYNSPSSGARELARLIQGLGGGTAIGLIPGIIAATRRAS